MSKDDLSWSIPVMRAGYAGRGIVYLVVAGVSLYTLWARGHAAGTSEALSSIRDSAWGIPVLVLIALGMLAYAIWRVVDATYDLEDYGTDAKGIIARAGMLVTGTLHLTIGILAVIALFKLSDGGSGSGLSDAVSKVMALPAGRALVALAGLVTIGAGLYYLHKAWKRKYREVLASNHFTRNWDPMLRAGVAAQGVIVTLIGGFITYAGLTADPEKAGGVGEAFSWLHEQAYGQILVIAVCIGLLGFALFCFVNATHRIIPKVTGDDIESLAKQFGDKAKRGAETATG